jgi:hypothetical protein
MDLRLSEGEARPTVFARSLQSIREETLDGLSAVLEAVYETPDMGMG